MRLTAATFAVLAALPLTPAYAGTVVPGPEAGLSLGALALVGVGYAYLRRRLNRR